MIKRVLATAAAAAAMILGGTTSAHAMTTPDADSFNGTTTCGSYSSGGTGYGYTMEKDIPISSAAWTRILANDPYGIKVQDTVWSKVRPRLGTVFPLYNFSSQTMWPSPDGVPYYTHADLNTAMNGLTCGSTFWLSGPKDARGIAALAYGGPHAGRFQVTQVRSNGISFKGIEGVMKGAVMNFRIVAGANRTFLNVHATGPAMEGPAGWLRDFMKGMADEMWQKFATDIGAAQ
jgi:hypothetical protein